uniref:Uncharacterized protein n=1 Tax=Varanus komodoensis TaxID=61221 RepID=A0A8D2IVR9_VARKO
ASDFPGQGKLQCWLPDSSPSITGEVGEDVVLLCQISLGKQLQNMEVQWKKIIGNHVSNIYQFTALTAQEIFGQGYQNRAVLMKTGIASGNVSLMLKKVRVSDEGVYRCIVNSVDWSDDTQTVLHVTGQKTCSPRVHSNIAGLVCRSTGWFPKPDLHWLTKSSQVNQQCESKQDYEQLFSLSSSMTVSRDMGEITCSVQGRRSQMRQNVTIFLSRELIQVHLDQKCKHPELLVSSDCSKVHHQPASGGADVFPGALIVIGNEGYMDGRQYWEVNVKDVPDWELGVLTEDQRSKLEAGKLDALEEEQSWSLRRSDGRYHPEEANSELEKYSLSLKVVGIYLDWKEKSVSFYHVKAMTAIVKMPVSTTPQKLYPFFSLCHSKGHDREKALTILHNKDWDFPEHIEAF